MVLFEAPSADVETLAEHATERLLPHLETELGELEKSLGTLSSMYQILILKIKWRSDQNQM